MTLRGAASIPGGRGVLLVSEVPNMAHYLLDRTWLYVRVGTSLVRPVFRQSVSRAEAKFGRAGVVL